MRRREEGKSRQALAVMLAAARKQQKKKGALVECQLSGREEGKGQYARCELMSRRGAGGGVAKIWWEGKERGQRRKAALMDGLATPGVGWPLVRGKEKENGDGEAGRAWDMQLVRGKEKSDFNFRFHNFIKLICHIYLNFSFFKIIFAKFQVFLNIFRPLKKYCES